MKKIILVSIIFASCILSCQESEPKPFENYLFVRGVSYNLENVNFFLAETETTGYFNDPQDIYETRTYLVTDATLMDVDKDIRILSTAYAGGSFVFYISLSTPVDNSFVSANYPTYYNYKSTPIATNRALISFDAKEEYWLTALRDSSPLTEIEVEVLEKTGEIKFNFEGDMHMGDDTPVDVRFQFKGTPVDLQSS